MAASNPTVAGPARDSVHMSAHAVGSAANVSTDLTDANPTDTGNASNQPKTRKRTKTGCLTCRKRRIKCGEERPTCNNCVKSKRNCEGYTPRVIFKDPLSGFPPAGGIPPGSGAQFHPMTDQDMTVSQRSSAQNMPANQIPLLPIAPRPLPRGVHHGLDSLPGLAGPGMPGDPYDSSDFRVDGQQYPQQVFPYGPQNLPPHRSQWDGDSGTVNVEQPPMLFPISAASPTFIKPGAGESDSGVDMTFTDRASESGQASDWGQSSTSSQPPVQAYTLHSRYGTTPPTSGGSGSNIPQSARLKQESPQPGARSFLYGYEGAESSLVRPHAMLGYPPSAGGTQNWDENGASWPGSNGHGPFPAQTMDPYMFPVPPHPISMVDDRDDDYWDADSEDEMNESYARVAEATPSDLGLMVALSANRNDRGPQSFLNEPNILSAYYPAYAASPLLDPQTARLFCHFVTMTGPTLSMYERHPSNPSAIFAGHPVPISQRSLWTYTLPMRALSHQGLLHAMLALSASHIAKLQRTPPMASLKHYHYALRRVAKALGQPAKRRDVSILAATLLLGYYEVTTAEHNKWNSHLAGARQLIMDIDFAGMGKRIAAQKAAGGQNALYHEFHHVYDHPYPGREFRPDAPMQKDNEIDEDLVSAIMGWQIRYDQHGFIQDGRQSETGNKPLTSKEMEEFDVQRDLFWWFCKQDMYQSMVSGNRLLLSYDRWSHCPPRAPVGKLDATFGTHDHLILLTARIADFAAKDVRRKVRATEASRKRSKPSNDFAPASNNQSQYFTRPAWSPPSSENAGGNVTPASSVTSQGQIPMYGMMPSAGPLRLPAGFGPEPEEGHHRIPPAQGLEAATLDAENEWNSICAALDAFEESLGRDYQPLSPDHMQPLSTPFGPALYYRSYPVACVWVLFYTARIMAMRAQPSMPPAAMIAASVAAPRTAGWANTIGRICAGIQPIPNGMPVNPSLLAAMMDSCMGLFHAGVQYRDAAQRGWIITKLRDVARMTGWQTSALIASGCERSWMKAAEMGKGPPYQRTMNAAAKDDRVAGRSRDPLALQRPPRDNNDRRFVMANPGTRVYWAMGILSAEEDMSMLNLND